MSSPPGDEPLPQPPFKNKSEVELEKLELEIAALKRCEEFENETREERRRKLYYDTQSARWQTSLIYRLSQFAAIITIFATMFGIYFTYNKLVTDRDNEFRQNQKDRVERTTTRYRNDLQELLQYPIDPKQTISRAAFLLRDLGDVVDNGFDEQERPQKREEIGFLLTQLIKSSEFDVALTRNSNFDRKAIETSKFYEDYLITHALDNRDILSKYKSALLSLHDQDWTYCENFKVDPSDPASFTEIRVEKDQNKFFQYAYLFHSYRKHVEMFNRNSGLPQPDPDLRKHLDLAFCWFSTASKNLSLTKAIFGGTDDQVKNKTSECQGGVKPPRAARTNRISRIATNSRTHSRPRSTSTILPGDEDVNPLRRRTMRRRGRR
jgi:hypothetical protein